MDVAVFHQNTKNLSPADAKFTYYKTRFKDIRKSMTSGYAIAGLTELLGDPRSLARKVPELTKMLDAKLSTGVVIAIGQLSSPRKVEYIGIGYDSNFFTLQAAGSVWRSTASAGWICFNAPAATVARNRSIVGVPPTSLKYRLDYRGLAYVIGLLNGDPYLFGFMHNDYGNGNRSGSFRDLGLVAEEILTTNNIDPEEVHIVFGGDFNVQPDDVAGHQLKLEARYVKNNNQAVNTTAGSPYDFWLVSDNIDFEAAYIHEETRNFMMSDHSGISLVFDY